MIISCPVCHSRYTVDPAVFGFAPRTVRCSTCGTEWHAQPEEERAVAVVATADTLAAAPARKAPRRAPEPAASPRPRPTPAPPSDIDDAVMAPAMARAASGSLDPVAAAASGRATQRTADNQPGSDGKPASGGDNDGRAAPATGQPVDSSAAAAPPAGEETREAPKPAAEKSDSPKGRIKWSKAPIDPFADEPGSRLRRLRIPAIIGGCLAAALGLVVLFREPIAALVPPLAPILHVSEAEPPAPKPGENLEIRNVTSARGWSGADEVIDIEGVIANGGDGARLVPSLKISLFNEKNEALQTVSVPAPKESLQAGETVPFQGRVVKPAPEARRLKVTFAVSE